MGEKVALLILTVMIIWGGCCNGAKVYKVGDSLGWTNTDITPSSYKSWSASKDFRLGDTLLFEYNKEFHDVVRVRHQEFNSCNSTTPLSTWVTGNDSFTIKRPGHFYFICSLPGHCVAGQKIDVRVTGHHKPKPGPSPSPAPRPAQSPKSGSSSLLPASSWKLCLFVAAFILSSVAF